MRCSLIDQLSTALFWCACRFIDHAIPDLNPEQRRMLKEQSQAGKRQAEERRADDQAKRARGAAVRSHRGAGRGVGSRQEKARGVGSVKDHAVSFLNAVLQEGLGAGPQAPQPPPPLSSPESSDPDK